MGGNRHQIYTNVEVGITKQSFDVPSLGYGGYGAGVGGYGAGVGGYGAGGYGAYPGRYGYSRGYGKKKLDKHSV